MKIKSGKLAIIAGGGELVYSCIKACEKKNIKFVLIGIEGFYNSSSYPKYINLSLNKIGNIFFILKKETIKNILFIGSIKKPSLLALRPNIVTIYYISLIIIHYFKGDDKLFSKIYNIFLNKGFQVIDVRQLLKKNITSNKNNNYNKFKANISLKQILKYFNLAKEYGILDKGQAIIVNENNVLLRENKNGTDDLLYRYKLLKRLDKFSLLVKICKPNQNIYFDLPTIGPNTIKNIVSSGLKGIIIEKNNSLIVSPEITFKLIKKHNLFYYAI